MPGCVKPTATESDSGVIVCSLYDAAGVEPPLSVAFAAKTGEELWSHQSLAPARHVFPRSMPQCLELVIHGDQVYLFGHCSLSMFIDCFSLSHGSLSYRSRPASKLSATGRGLVPDGKG